MLDYILIALGIIIVVPTLVFLCMRQGVVGFYRGKEAAKRLLNEFSRVQDDNENNEIES